MYFRDSQLLLEAESFDTKCIATSVKLVYSTSLLVGGFNAAAGLPGLALA